MSKYIQKISQPTATDFKTAKKFYNRVNEKTLTIAVSNLINKCTLEEKTKSEIVPIVLEYIIQRYSAKYSNFLPQLHAKLLRSIFTAFETAGNYIESEKISCSFKEFITSVLDKVKTEISKTNILDKTQIKDLDKTVNVIFLEAREKLAALVKKYNSSQHYDEIEKFTDGLESVLETTIAEYDETISTGKSEEQTEKNEAVKELLKSNMIYSKKKLSGILAGSTLNTLKIIEILTATNNQLQNFNSKIMTSNFRSFFDMVTTQSEILNSDEKLKQLADKKTKHKSRFSFLKKNSKNIADVFAVSIVPIAAFIGLNSIGAAIGIGGLNWILWSAANPASAASIFGAPAKLENWLKKYAFSKSDLVHMVLPETTAFSKALDNYAGKNVFNILKKAKSAITHTYGFVLTFVKSLVSPLVYLVKVVIPGFFAPIGAQTSSWFRELKKIKLVTATFGTIAGMILGSVITAIYTRVFDNTTQEIPKDQRRSIFDLTVDTLTSISPGFAFALVVIDYFIRGEGAALNNELISEDRLSGKAVIKITDEKTGKITFFTSEELLKKQLKIDENTSQGKMQLAAVKNQLKARETLENIIETTNKLVGYLRDANLLEKAKTAIDVAVRAGIHTFKTTKKKIELYLGSIFGSEVNSIEELFSSNKSHYINSELTRKISVLKTKISYLVRNGITKFAENLIWQSVGSVAKALPLGLILKSFVSAAGPIGIGIAITIGTIWKYSSDFARARKQIADSAGTASNLFFESRLSELNERLGGSINPNDALTMAERDKLSQAAGGKMLDLVESIEDSGAGLPNDTLSEYLFADNPEIAKTVEFNKRFSDVLNNIATFIRNEHTYLQDKDEKTRGGTYQVRRGRNLLSYFPDTQTDFMSFFGAPGEPGKLHETGYTGRLAFELSYRRLTWLNYLRMAVANRILQPKELFNWWAKYGTTGYMQNLAALKNIESNTNYSAKIEPANPNSIEQFCNEYNAMFRTKKRNSLGKKIDMPKYSSVGSNTSRFTYDDILKSAQGMPLTGEVFSAYISQANQQTDSYLDAAKSYGAAAWNSATNKKESIWSRLATTYYNAEMALNNTKLAGLNTASRVIIETAAGVFLPNSIGPGTNSAYSDAAAELTQSGTILPGKENYTWGKNAFANSVDFEFNDIDLNYPEVFDNWMLVYGLTADTDKIFAIKQMYNTNYYNFKNQFDSLMKMFIMNGYFTFDKETGKYDFTDTKENGPNVAIEKLINVFLSAYGIRKKIPILIAKLDDGEQTVITDGQFDEMADNAVEEFNDQNTEAVAHLKSIQELLDNASETYGKQISPETARQIKTVIEASIAAGAAEAEEPEDIPTGELLSIF